MQPQGILPVLTRLPIFLMVTVVAHKVVIVSLRLAVNCLSLAMTCSTGVALLSVLLDLESGSYRWFLSITQ